MTGPVLSENNSEQENQTRQEWYVLKDLFGGYSLLVFNFNFTLIKPAA